MSSVHDSRNLESQRQELKLAEVIESLNMTLQNFSGERKSLDNDIRLDGVMSNLIKNYNLSIKEVQQQFAQTQYGLQQSLASEQARNQAVTLSTMSQINATISALTNQINAMGAPTPGPGPLTMASDATSAGSMYRYNLNYMADMGYIGRSYGYGENLLTDSFQAKILPWYLKQGTLSPMQYQMTINATNNRLAEKQSPEQIRNYMEYQQQIFEDSQKAKFNKALAASLGRDNMFNRGDFEAIVQPAMSSLSEDLNVSLDSIGALLNKMSSMRVIADNIKNGGGTDILNAIDSTSNILGKVSSLIKSNDLSELTQYAAYIATIGNGDFNYGMKALNTSSGIMKGFSTPQYSLNDIARESAAFDNSFGGASLASANMGAWAFRNRNLLASYSSGDFYGNGLNPTEAIGPYINYLTSRAAGLNGMLYDFGGSGVDRLYGSEKLSDYALKNPLSFYLNSRKLMRESSGRVSGISAEYDIELETRKLSSEFGMSRDEALLALMGGDPNTVLAYKEVLSAKDKYATDQELRMKRAEYMNLFQPGKSFSFTDREGMDYSNTALLSILTGESALSQLGKDAYINVAANTLKDVREMLPSFRSGLDEIYTGLSDIKASADVFSPDAGFNKLLSDKNANVLVHMLNIVGEGRARDAIQQLAVDISEGKKPPKFNDIKYVLISGLQDYISNGQISGDLRQQIINYISKLTPQQALREIGPLIPKEDPFYALLEVMVDPSKTANLYTKASQYLRANLVGSLKSAGWSTSQISSSLIQESSTLKDLSSFVQDNFLVSQSVGSAAGAIAGIAAAAAGTGGAALIPIAVGLLAAPVLGEGLEIANSVNDYTSVLLGNKIDVNAITETLGVGEADELTVQARVMLLQTRALLKEEGAVWNKTRTVRLVQTAISMYAAAYNAYLAQSNSQQINKSRPPLAKAAADAAVQQLLEAINRNESGIMEYDPTKWARGMIGLLNLEDSPIGKRIRNSPKAEQLATLFKLIKTEADNVSVGGVSGILDTTVRSFENIYTQTGGDITKILADMGYRVAGSREIIDQLNDIKEFITVKGGDSEDAVKAEKVVNAIKSSQMSGRYDSIRNLSDEEIDSYEKLLKDGSGTLLKKLKNEKDDNIIRREIAPQLAGLMLKAQESQQTRLSHATEMVDMFNQVINQLKNSPAKENVIKLGEMLRGDV